MQIIHPPMSSVLADPFCAGQSAMWLDPQERTKEFDLIFFPHYNLKSFAPRQELDSADFIFSVAEYWTISKINECIEQQENLILRMSVNFKEAC